MEGLDFFKSEMDSFYMWRRNQEEEDLINVILPIVFGEPSRKRPCHGSMLVQRHQKNEIVHCRDKHPDHTPEDTCSQVLGKRSRYVKGLGHGKMASRSQSARPISADIAVAKRRAELAKQEIGRLRRVVQSQQQRLDEQQQKLEETRQQVASLNATVQRLIALLP